MIGQIYKQLPSFNEALVHLYDGPSEPEFVATRRITADDKNSLGRGSVVDAVRSHAESLVDEAIARALGMSALIDVTKGGPGSRNWN